VTTLRPTPGQRTGLPAPKKRPSNSRKARAARRRQRRLVRSEQDLTAAQWAALQAAWGGCAYCGSTAGSFQRDCVLPVSNGGRYTLANVVPACRSCNTSKWRSEVTGWLRRKKLDERAFLLRHVEIRATLALQFAPATELQAAPASAEPPIHSLP
jgi:5-methylcytosine-specific restriction endonuclease McrA